MQNLYTSAICFYGFLLRLAAVFNPKARRLLRGRAVLQQTLSQISDDKNAAEHWQLAWFHCASLGEFEQARPVIEAYRTRFPKQKILLTFFSPSGYEVRKNYELADYVTYLPLDLPPLVRQFLDTASPQIGFFVKYDFWPNLLQEASKRNIELYAFSVIFREKQVYFRTFGKFFRKALFSFKHIFVQNENSKTLLEGIGYQEVSVVGDTRFDRVARLIETPVSVPFIEQFKANHELLLIGSAWQADIGCVFLENKIQTHFPSLKYIIAPHELNESQMDNWEKKIGLKTIRYSQISISTNLSDYQVLMIDSIGLLSALYQFADFAFIGGAFGKGLHNTLEAAVYGMPIFFGNKNYAKFQEAIDLIEIGGAFVVSTDFLEKLTEIYPHRNAISQKTANYVKTHTGATDVLMTFITNFLSDKPI